MKHTYLITWTYRDDNGKFYNTYEYADTIQETYRVYFRASEQALADICDETLAVMPMPQVFIIDGNSRALTDEEEDYLEPATDENNVMIDAADLELHEFTI